MKIELTKKEAQALITMIDAAVRANPLNKSCPCCGRAVYGAARFCGGERCRKN